MSVFELRAVSSPDVVEQTTTEPSDHSQTPASTSNAHDEDDGFESFLSNWYKVYEKYMFCKLTIQSDRIIAFAGAAKEISDLSGLGYAAGLWERDLEGQLTWIVQPGSAGRRTEEFRAPSWSWLSIDGPVQAPDRMFKTRAVAEVTKVHVEPRFPTHHIKNGYLEVTGHLQEVGRLGEEVFDERDSHRYSELSLIGGDGEPVQLLNSEVEAFWDGPVATETGKRGIFFFATRLQATAYGQPELQGLILERESQLAALPVEPGIPVFHRLGVFKAKSACICRILSHIPCQGSGCSFPSLSEKDARMGAPAATTNLFEQYRLLREEADRRQEEADELQEERETSFVQSLRKQAIMIV